MTQHIATAKSGLCRFKGKNVAVMFGFDRPLNEMFFNIIEIKMIDGKKWKPLSLLPQLTLKSGKLFWILLMKKDFGFTPN